MYKETVANIGVQKVFLLDPPRGATRALASVVPRNSNSPEGRVPFAGPGHPGEAKPGEAMETEWFCHSKWWTYMDL